MNHRQDAARRPADLVCVLQDHGDAEVVVPDHRKGLTQQQDDIPARLHHLKVRLISQGPLYVHLKERNGGNEVKEGRVQGSLFTHPVCLAHQ